MKEIFEIPSYYNNLLNEIASDHIHTLIQSNPLDYMRTLFKEDNKMFYSVRDELILRGIGFKREYRNNYLLGKNYEIHSIVIKTEDTKSYKKINFSMHGGANFIDRFNVESDIFFHNMPWEGILYFLPKATTDFLRKEFEKEGFSIVSVDNFQAIPLRSTEESICEISGNNIINNEWEPNSVYDYTKLDLPIEDHFSENMFGHFRKYCQENKILKFSDLTLDKIGEYSNQKFTRSKTVDVIRENFTDINRKYNPLPFEFQETVELLQNNRFMKLCEIAGISYLDTLNKFYESDNVYDDIFPIEKIEQLCNYVNENFEQLLQEKEEKKKQEKMDVLVNEISNHKNYKYLLSMSIQELSNMFSIKAKDLPEEELYLYDIIENAKYFSFLNALLKAMNSMVELYHTVKNAVGSLNPREKEVLEHRKSMTLKEVGDMIGVTRERVRQIEAKANKKITAYKNQSMIKSYFKFYTEHSRLVDMKEFCNYYKIKGVLETIIIKKFLMETTTIRYMQSISRFINREDYELIANTFEKVDLAQPIIEVSQIRQFISAEIIDELQVAMDMLIKAQGYLRVKEIYVKEKISIIDRIEYLFEHHIREPLHMDDEGYAYFTKIMNETFGIPYDSSKRSASARIADSDNIILVDSNTFFRHEAEKVTAQILASLENIIDETLLTQPFADPRVIYNEKPKLVKSASIRSSVHLYSLVQMYLGEKYDTGHRNTLYIYPANMGAMDAESILINYLTKNGHEVSYDKVLKDLKWKAPKLDQLLERIDSVVTVKNKTLKTIESFKFTEEEVNELKAITNEELQQGYIFIEDLAFDLAFNQKLDSLVDRAGLSDVTTLSSIVKWLHGDVNGYLRLLYKSTSNIKSLEKAISIEFLETVSRAELSEFTFEKGYSEQRIATLPYDIVKSNLFYPYTGTQFINSDIINFNEDVKKSLQHYLAGQFANTPYKSVFAMMGFSNHLLPISKYEWTEWLIYHFAEEVGYRKVIVNNSDYRYNKLLLVKDDSSISTLDELVYFIAKTDYTGKQHEEDFAKYLASKDIIYNPRRLSNEIYHSKLFEFDSFGFFQLR